MKNVSVQTMVALHGWSHRLAWTNGSFRGYLFPHSGVRAIESSGHTTWSGDEGFEDLWERHAPKPLSEAETLYFALFASRKLCRVWRHVAARELPYDEAGRLKFMSEAEEKSLKESHGRVIEAYWRAIGQSAPSRAL